MTPAVGCMTLLSGNKLHDQKVANACNCCQNHKRIFMTHRILLIKDLAALLRTSPSTIGRKTNEARQGLTDFPLPISAPGKRRQWDAHVIEQWLANRANVALPVNVPVAKSEKQKSRNFAERQLAADATLARHATNRKGGTR